MILVSVESYIMGKLAKQKLSNALPHFHFLEQAYLIMQKEANFKILLDCRHLN